MKNMKRYKDIRSLLTIFALLALMLPVMTSCSDEPEEEYFYTFKGEMMSDYLRNRSQYSQFAKCVERANLMDLLSTYGQYTCLLPSNDAMTVYLQKRGLSSVDQLNDADCDTIARTHLLANMYSTIEMTQDRLQTANFLGRYISTKVDTTSVEHRGEIMLEGVAYISNTLKDDSVENGIVQPISAVIEKSTSNIASLLRDDKVISIFFQALRATGVEDEIAPVVDPTYDRKNYTYYDYKSHTWPERAWVPDTKKYGFTIFAEPDELLMKEFSDRGISTANGTLRALYDLACQEYDPVYPADVSKPGHSFNNLTSDVNPLKRFMRYHILNRYVSGTDDLTAMEMTAADGKEGFGFETSLVNPTDWYQTLLPHTMMKVERMTRRNINKTKSTLREGNSIKGEHYLNRRYETLKDGTEFKFDGAHVIKVTGKYDDGKDKICDALNGYYFYVDQVVSFNYNVQNIVQNVRIRMDFSSIFPEVMTNDMRLKGDPYSDDTRKKADGSSENFRDESATPKNGRNFYFPNGYLDGVTIANNCYLVMRRPHINFWSWQGDEWNMFGDYDISFRVPPVPVSGDYQLRLGFCALETRGVMQVYFDGVAQGIPLDMRNTLNSEAYLGSRFDGDETAGTYDKMSDEDKADQQKTLKNLGAYRAPRSTYHFNSNGKKYYFVGTNGVYRRILCQAYIDNESDHYLRFRVASNGKQGNNNEFMLDYLEIVPKSVYSVDGDGEMEDDL